MISPLVRSCDHIQVMGHVIADYPDPQLARSAVSAMVEAGVKLIEVQIPFSEPMADGPTFMLANHKAVANGVSYQTSLAMMREITSAHDVSFVFMTYANVIYQRGFEEFVTDAKEAGARGVIVPDLPIDAVPEFEKACIGQQFANVIVVPPNISEDRLALLCSKAQGLIYAVARTGVTGSKTNFDARIDAFLARIRRYSDLPIAVGFGVRSAADVQSLSGKADLAVIGSRGLEVLEQEGIEGVKVFWQSVCQKQ